MDTLEWTRKVAHIGPPLFDGIAVYLSAAIVVILCFLVSTGGSCCISSNDGIMVIDTSATALFDAAPGKSPRGKVLFPFTSAFWNISSISIRLSLNGGSG
jgi:hypothetical protein